MDLAKLITALENPRIYPEKPNKIDLVQTHISVIFLTGQRVYKIKKPVNFGFLDFTTLEKRKFYSQQEVDLNRRLSPEIYLGVVEIRDHQGRIFIGEGPGEIIEYAVLMKQLPSDCTMDRWLARGAVTPEMIEKIAAKIALFHSQAAANPEIAAFGEIETVRVNIEENFTQTEKYVGQALSAEAYREIQENNRRFMENHLFLFRKRVAEGKIRDCHGDLHLQHICLGEEILIFDCIEFNQRFRYSDVAADIAFLLMDLDSHGEPMLSADLASAYLKDSQDWQIFLLLNFYKSYRAYIRAKVTCFRLDDPVISTAEKTLALEEAKRYFQLSQYYALKLNPPTLLVTCGLMGTGKSTIARSVSEALGWKLLRSDVLRKELAHLSSQEHRFENFHQGIYSPDFSRRTYRVLFEKASALLNSGQSLILDGSFKKQADRQEALALARHTNADFLLVECQCSEEEIQRRMARRAAEESDPSDGRWEIFSDQKKDYDKMEGIPSEIYLSLNTERSLRECLGQIFQHLLRRRGRELSAALF
ncbi:MAG TPA: AAA family ATPase [Thermodesulfobacteriota bacterium]|nr:AAA family ATPase [Thermodesulfobacteriota bacterium]